MTSRAGALVLGALIPVVALAVDPEGWYWFGPVKWLAVSMLVPAAAALLFATRPTTVVVRPTLAAAILVAVMAVAAIFGRDARYAWIGTPERHFGVVTWVICLLALVAGSTLGRGEQRSLVLGGIAAAGLGVGLTATAEALGWEPAAFDVGSRLSATFGSPAYLGAAVALLLPSCAGIALDRTCSRPARFMATASTLPLAVALIGSGARAAWVGLVAAAAVLLVAKREVLRRNLRRSAVGAAVVVAALVVVAIATPAGGRVSAAFDRDAPGGSGRLDEWRVAARIAADNPIVGVGPEGYRIAFAGGVDSAYERAHGRDPLPDRAHSAPLDVAVNGGVPALVSWLAFVALVAVHLWRALRGRSTWLAGMAVGLLAHVTGSLLLFPLAELEPIAWLLAGIVLMATARPSEVRAIVTPRPVTAVLALVAVVALAAGVLDVVADRRARIAVDLLGEGRSSAAYAHAADAASLRPDSVRLHLLAARTALAADRGTLAALEHVERALGQSPDDPIARHERASLLVDRARATMLPEHADVARDAVRALVAGDGHNAALRMLEGEAARLAGDSPAAEASWQLAEELAPRDAAPSVAIAALALSEQRVDAARDAVRRALDRDPQDERAIELLRLVDQAR